MSGLAHYLEREGLATVIVALVREHIVSMQPPRALWVPFELGRPFGPPGDDDLQLNVLRAALALLDRPASSPLLEDLNLPPLHDEDDPGWRFPAVLASDDESAEAASVLPVWRLARERLGRTTVGNSGFDPETAVEFVQRYLGDDPLPNPKGMAPVARVRFAIDDIKAFYLEAALAEGGQPTSRQLREWFWGNTLVGDLLRRFQDHARTSDDRNLRMISGSLVPAELTLAVQRKYE